MFCNNCGSKLPDGSRFCSVCGTRLVDLEPSVSEAKPTAKYGYAEDLRADAEKAQSYETAAARVSFDWSNVIEEPVKKVVPEVRSPWVEPVVEERPSVEKPALDHRRTMSFIEILKQEREEKLRAAELEAQAVTERPEIVPDYSAFDNAPQVYAEYAKNAEAPLYEEPIIEEPKFEEPKIEETPLRFETANILDYEPPLHTLVEPAAEEPHFEAADLFKDIEAPSITAPTLEDEIKIDSLNIEDYYDQTLDFGEAEPSNLEAELDAILNAGASRISRAERNAAEAAAEEAANSEPEVQDLYLESEMEAPLVEEPQVDETMFAPVEAEELAPVEAEAFAPIIETEEIAPIVETEEAEAPEEVPAYTYDDSMFAPANTIDEAIAAPEFEAPLYEEPVYEEPTMEIPSFVEEFVETEPAVEEIAVEEPAVEEAPTVEEIVAADAAKPYDTTRSTIAPAADEESEIEELKRRLALLMSDDAEAKPAEEPALEPEDEAAEAEAKAEEEATDAISLDALEKELFGDEVPEDVEAEATKKIDKFYTLYKKNEEFQRLLDEEYNKLKEEDGENQSAEMPVVEKLGETENKPETPAEEEKKEEVPAPKSEDKEAKAAAKKAQKEAKAAAKKAKKEKNAKKPETADAAEAGEQSGGSGVLTVLAIIIAVLLVILLGVILVLNFAPDSGIAMTIDSLIENVASYFSDAGMIDKISLL